MTVATETVDYDRLLNCAVALHFVAAPDVLALGMGDRAAWAADLTIRAARAQGENVDDGDALALAGDVAIHWMADLDTYGRQDGVHVDADGVEYLRDNPDVG